MCNAVKKSGLKVPVIGIIKEEEKDPAELKDKEEILGVVEFERDYFCGPLFLSGSDRTIYKYFGDEKIFTFGTLFKALRNPFKARSELKTLSARLKERKIEGNMKGDGLVKGGVLCIAPSGKVEHTFFEDPGNSIPADAVEKIIAAARSLSSGR